MGENENVGTPLDLREQLAAAFAADDVDAGGGAPAEGMSSAVAEGEQAQPADNTPVSEAGTDAAEIGSLFCGKQCSQYCADRNTGGKGIWTNRQITMGNENISNIFASCCLQWLPVCVMISNRT